MTTLQKHKECSFIMLFTVLVLFHTSLVYAEQAKPQRVFQVCECQFPAEVGAYQHIKVVSFRHTILKITSTDVSMVREIFGERNGQTYRFVSLVDSTETKTVGKIGPVIEILKWNGPYWPSEVIYQLPIDKVYFAAASMKEE